MQVPESIMMISVALNKHRKPADRRPDPVYQNHLIQRVAPGRILGQAVGHVVITMIFKIFFW